MEVIKAKVYGLCSGVKYALNYVKKVKAETKDQKIYLIGNLVHNQVIMNHLKNEGIIILNECDLKSRIDNITSGVIIFSAHGHDPKLDEYAKNKGLIIKDATCPKVLKNMHEIKKVLNENKPVIYIGIKNHEEANAALSLGENIIFVDYKNPLLPFLKLKDVHVFNQTTLNVLTLKELHEKISSTYDNVVLHNDICDATAKRQLSLNDIGEDVSYILILGDKSSSNTMRLKEIAKTLYSNKIVLLFSTLEEVKAYPFDITKKIFLTAGASTPDEVINPSIEYLLSL